jgi:hypothetical protein
VVEEVELADAAETPTGRRAPKVVLPLDEDTPGMRLGKGHGDAGRRERAPVARALRPVEAQGIGAQTVDVRREHPQASRERHPPERIHRLRPVRHPLEGDPVVDQDPVPLDRRRNSLHRGGGDIQLCL